MIFGTFPNTEYTKNINKINTETIDVPYAYPLYLKNGMEIKKSLTKSGIYVATLWPDAIQEGNELEKDFAENILPLPIDQRYDEDINGVVATNGIVHDEVIKVLKDFSFDKIDLTTIFTEIKWKTNLKNLKSL